MDLKKHCNLLLAIQYSFIYSKFYAISYTQFQTKHKYLIINSLEEKNMYNIKSNQKGVWYSIGRRLYYFFS